MACVNITHSFITVGLKQFTAIINTEQTSTKSFTANNSNDHKHAGAFHFVYDVRILYDMTIMTITASAWSINLSVCLSAVHLPLLGHLARVFLFPSVYSST